MRTMQYRTARHQFNTVMPVGLEKSLCEGLSAPGVWVAAATHALDGIVDVVTHECFDNPDTITIDGITAYALALMRLRECANEAGFERLMNACDALAVTVSRLIEDKNCASPEKCEALTRFVAHAQAMIEMHDTCIRHHSMPVAAARMVADTSINGARH